MGDERSGARLGDSDAAIDIGGTDGDRLRTRVRQLAWATVVYNVIEALVAISAGTAAGSAALVGFGLDSTIEVASALVIIWQFSGIDEQREQRALRLIAVSFFGLATYLSIRAVLDLAGSNEAETSTIGIVLATASLIVMPALAVAKRRAGQQLGSVTVTADSQQTLLCTYLSAVLLVGLVLNATIGWWWADPIAALIIAALAAREGRDAWNGDTCCD